MEGAEQGVALGRAEGAEVAHDQQPQVEPVRGVEVQVVPLQVADGQPFAGRGLTGVGKGTGREIDARHPGAAAGQALGVQSRAAAEISDGGVRADREPGHDPRHRPVDEGGVARGDVAGRIEVEGEHPRRGVVVRPQRLGRVPGKRRRALAEARRFGERRGGRCGFWFFHGVCRASTGASPVSVRTKRGRATASIWVRSGGESMAA